MLFIVKPLRYTWPCIAMFMSCQTCMSIRFWQQQNNHGSSLSCASQLHNHPWSIWVQLCVVGWQTLNKVALFCHSNQWLMNFLCALVLSEIWAVAMVSTCMAYFITPIVSSVLFDVTFSFWYVVFFLLSAFTFRDQKWSKPMLWSVAWWQFRQQQQHACSHAAA